MKPVAAAALVLLQTAVPQTSPQGNAQGTALAVQLGTDVRPDTVTVGQRFVVVLRVRAPGAASIRFPIASRETAPASKVQIIGRPVVQVDSAGGYTNGSAAYAVTAWDTGDQPLGLSNVEIVTGARTGYVSLADLFVHVRSVLPPDTTQHVPKPARPGIVLTPFNWMPFLLAAAVLAALAAAWTIWRWYQRRRNRTLSAYEIARREFARIDSMRLLEAGRTEEYFARVTDTLRVYLADRVDGAHRSQTTTELVNATTHLGATLGDAHGLLRKGDLVKFARASVAEIEASDAGRDALAVVERVEQFLVDEAKRTRSADVPSHVRRAA